MGKNICFGGGRHVNFIGWWVYSIVCCVAGILFFYFLARNFGYVEVPWVGAIRTRVYYYFLYFGFGLGALTFVIEAYVYTRWKKTEIEIYENGIKGIGVGPLLRRGELTSFNLEYDKIASVDATKTTRLTINSYGKEYVIYVESATHYANIINEQIKKATLSKNVKTVSASTTPVSSDVQRKFCSYCGYNIDDVPGAFCPGCGAKKP